MVAQLALEKQHLTAFPAEARAPPRDSAGPRCAPVHAAPLPPADAALRPRHARAGGFGAGILPALAPGRDRSNRRRRHPRHPGERQQRQQDAGAARQVRPAWGTAPRARAARLPNSARLSVARRVARLTRAAAHQVRARHRPRAAGQPHPQRHRQLLRLRAGRRGAAGALVPGQRRLAHGAVRQLRAERLCAALLRRRAAAPGGAAGGAAERARGRRSARQNGGDWRSEAACGWGARGGNHLWHRRAHRPPPDVAFRI